ncbi:MAG: acyltransferase [Mucilaginibacter sp.]|nr:acyltransferase [Mucilaginibacter sp.]
MKVAQQAEFKVNNFDLLRLMAATQVVFDHFYEHIRPTTFSFYLNETRYLFPGVPVFFMISGYLISASLERSHNLGIYFKNRALRIFPGLWGCLFLTVIVFSITGVNFLNLQAFKWLPAQMVGIIYTPGFLSNYGFGSYNGALWSITVELQFYVVLPILYMLIPKKSAIYWFLGLIVVFAIAFYFFRTHNFPHQNAIGFTFVPHIYLFLVGVVFQKLQIYKSKFIFNKAHYWVAAYLLYIYGVSGFLLPVSPLTYTFIKNGLLGFIIISIAYTLPGIAKKILGTNDISYGIYIYHGLIMTVIVQLKLAGSVNLFMILVATYAAATLSWLFIERPFIKRKEKTIKEVL